MSFSLIYTPPCIVRWLSRTDDLWPPIETRKEILSNGFHIVAKDIPGVDNGWRVSVSKAETSLFNVMTKLQKYVYFVLKCIFYLHIKCEIDLSWINGTEYSKTLPSYFLKTCYLHYMRSKPSQWWARKDAVEATLKEMFNILKQCLEKGHCESFLVFQQNIFNLEEIPSDVMGDITLQCAIIAEDPLRFFPGVSQLDVNHFVANIYIFMSSFKAVDDVHRWSKKSYKSVSISTNQIYRMNVLMTSNISFTGIDTTRIIWITNILESTKMRREKNSTHADRNFAKLFLHTYSEI